MLWLGYDSPVTDRDTTVATFLSTLALTPLDGLRDGRPGTQTLVRWGAGDTSRFQFEFARTFQPGVAVLVNVTGDNITPSTQFRVTYRRTGGSFDYEQMTTNLVQFPNGDVHGVLMWPAGLEDDVEAAQVDLIDASMAPLTDTFTVGEVFIATAARARARIDDFRDHVVQRTRTDYSPSGQPSLTQMKNTREVDLSFLADSLEVAYGDLQDVLNRIADNPLVFLTVSDEVPELASVPESIRRLSMYGVVEQGARSALSGSRLMQTPFKFREVR